MAGGISQSSFSQPFTKIQMKQGNKEMSRGDKVAQTCQTLRIRDPNLDVADLKKSC